MSALGQIMRFAHELKSTQIVFHHTVTTFHTFRNKVTSLLAAGSKRLQIDLLYAARGGFWLSLGQGTSTLTGLLVTIILANTLSEESFGSYKYMLSLYGIVAIFSLTGMPTAIIRAVAKGEDGALYAGIRTSLRWSWLMIAISVTGSIYYFLHSNTTLGWSFAIIGLCTPFLNSIGYYNAYLNGKKDYRMQSMFSISYSILPSLLLIISAVYTQNALVIFCTFLLSHIAIHAAHLTITIRKYHPTGKAPSTTISYGKHLSLMNILGGIAFQMDKILVWQHLGAAPLALYSVALAPPQQLRYLSKILSTITLPRFSTRSAKSLKGGVHRKALVVLIGATLLSLTYILIAPYLFQVFFPKYLDAVLYSQVFSLIVLFFPSVLYQQALFAHMRKKALYVLQVGMPLLKIALLFALLPTMGIWGALLSMFASETIRLILVLVFFSRMVKHKPVAHESVH